MTDGPNTPFILPGDPMMQDPERRREAYAKVFGTLEGRQVLADILMRGGCARPAYEPDQPDYREALYNAGAHSLSLAIAVDAGLDVGRIGLALVEGELETMMEPQHETETKND